MRGLDVMMVDFRGYGNNQGLPTAYKTKLDMETAYQYLAKEHGVKNKDLLLHGHCFGAAPATDLAARRKGISIIVDKSFSKFQNIVAREAEEKFESETAKGRIRSISRRCFYRK
jgi:alpha/beta superfamily hydrolase